MNKKTLSESDICDKFIRPAVEAAGWDGMSQIYREYPLRAGRVVVRGRKARRDVTTTLRADYALFFKTNIPLAAVEAKDNNHAVGAGMAQAINYAGLLDVPFSFSSNGDGFVFRDATMADGVLERSISLEEFPSPEELWKRLCAWKGWTPAMREITEFDQAKVVGEFFKLAVQNACNTLEDGDIKGVAVKHLHLNVLRGLKVPIPPLDEQRRIVTRVTELRRLCTDLRQRLAAQQTVQSHLADALVERALA